MEIEEALQWVEKNCSDAETLDRLRSRRVAKTLAEELMAVRRERDELIFALKEIAYHHDKQRLLFDEIGDSDNRRYHEDRRNVALIFLTPNVK